MIRKIIKSIALAAGTALRFVADARGTWEEQASADRRAFQRGAIAALVGLVVVGGLLGLVVLVSGVVPIGASGGHWAVTRWFLDFAKDRSVSTHSYGVVAPSLDDPDLILKGALHYDIGCRPCHGRPGMKYPRIAQSMTPKAPYLPPGLSEWDSAELFHIVKHGIKFTGMPAWPAQQRDDEVWAVVAFLWKLPELDEAEYRRLVDSGDFQSAPIETMGLPPAAAVTLTESCARCHGGDGIARGDGAFPNLAGQRREYLENSLHAYIRGDRHSGIMQPIAAGLDADVIRELANYYSSLAPPPQRAGGDPEKIQRGSEIARFGIPSERVPACMECHDPAGRQARSAYPSLTGQPADYLVEQLELFQKRKRGGTRYAHLMHHVVDRLDAAEMRAVALYFESLPPEK